MNAARGLRYLILSMWSAVVVSGVFDFALESRLPAPLQEHLADQFKGGFTTGESIGLVIGLVALVLVIHGSIQLCRLRVSGRRTFLIGNVLGILATLFFGPIVSHAWSTAFAETAGVISGIVIGWTYFFDAPLDFKGVSTARGPRAGLPPLD